MDEKKWIGVSGVPAKDVIDRRLADLDAEIAAELAARLAAAQQKLSKTKCTCPPDPDGIEEGHDMFYLACELTKAEIEVDDVLAAMGIEI